MAELERIALCKHETPVSRIVSISFWFLKTHCPGLRLLISYADPSYQHHGGIYQAGNWIYTGRSPDDWKAVWSDGREAHSRIARGHVQFGVLKTVDISEAKKVHVPGKYRYLMPLDDEMRKRIEPLRKPYPKRDKQAIASFPEDSGGAAPTVTLQSKEK